MDIKLQNDEWKLKLRVAGCVVKDDKILGVQMCTNKFYCLPGGHVELGESTEDAVIREMKEEIDLDCKIVNLICFLENFFKSGNKKVHEICYFYLMEPKEDIVPKDYTREENDKGVLKELRFKWLDLNSLQEVDFRPPILKEKLYKKNWNFEHIIFNELK